MNREASARPPNEPPKSQLFGEVYGLLQESGLRNLPIVVEGGKPLGMLALEDIGQAGSLGQPTRS